MRIAWQLATAVAASAAINIHGDQSLAASRTSIQSKGRVITTDLIPPCAGGTPAASWTIRLHVKKGWDPIHPGRHVRFQHSGQGGSDADQGNNILDPTDPNPFHIDIRDLPGLDTSAEHYARVRIILVDPQAHFATWTNAAKQSITAVGVGDNPNNMICGLSAIESGPMEIVTFFVHINPKTTATPSTATFAFGLLGVAPDTPILIDPAVKNYG